MKLTCTLCLQGHQVQGVKYLTIIAAQISNWERTAGTLRWYLYVNLLCSTEESFILT